MNLVIINGCLEDIKTECFEAHARERRWIKSRERAPLRLTPIGRGSSTMAACGSPQKKQDQKIYVDFLQKFTCLMKTSGCVCTGCRMCSPGFLRQWCSNHREVADHCPGSIGHELQTQVMFEAVCCVITCYTILNC